VVTFFCVLTPKNMQLNSLIGKKVYQKQGFLQDSTRVPLTGVVVAGNIVTQIKTTDKEGYSAIQLGVTAKKRANKAIQGHAKKALDAKSPKMQNPTSSPVSTSAPQTNSSVNTSSVPKYFKEVRVEDTSDFNLGTEIQVAEVFAPGDVIDVTGISKGKGWAGGVKRWGFHGGPRTHGQSDRERAPGSIGQTTTPGRVYRGKKMAGRMGNDTVTVKNLEVIEVTDDGVLLIKGLVPGRTNGMLIVKKTGENKKFVPLYKEVEEEVKVEEKVEAEESASQLPVSDDAQKGNGDSRSSVSSDVQESTESQSSDTPSLNDSPAPKSDGNQQVEQQPTVDSAEDGQAPIADKLKEDTKTEKEDSPANA
jgi:large subunit ribosomal protein L3